MRPLALNGTEPVLAWVESNGDRHELFVRRWDGTTWQAMGGALIKGSESVLAGFHPRDLSLIPDTQGGLLLAWAVRWRARAPRARHRTSWGGIPW